MTVGFPGKSGSKEGRLLPGLPGQLAMEDKCLGFLLRSLCGCVYACTDAGSPILLNIQSLMVRVSS